MSESFTKRLFVIGLIAFVILCMPVLGQTATIFNNWNGGVVDSNPTCSPSFTISEPQMITYIDTYHWNSGHGTPTSGTISLKKDSGETLGPWTVTAESGSGAANVWWISHPNVVIPAGTYTIIDSEPETWSRNSESNGCGFSKVEGHPEESLSGQETTIDSTKKPETSMTAPSSGGSFKITNIDYPREVKANGARGDLAVYWSGDPVFPVKMVYRPISCSPGITCTTPTMTFDVRQNPLVFPEAVWCTGNGGIYFDYEVVIIDARGIESAPFQAPFTCKGSTDLSGQENAPDSIAKKPESSITTTSTSGLKDSLAGDWIMQGRQTGVENSDYKAVLTLNVDGTLNWRQTEGANVGTTRSGTWDFSGSTITMKWSSPKGGQITWISTSVSTEEISEGTYTAERVTGGTWSASRREQSTTETSMTETEVAMEQSTVPDKTTLTAEGSATGLTKDQKDFLQATLDDLSKIGRKDTAVKLNKYIAEGHATIGEETPGTLASVKSPLLGYLDPISSNKMVINQDTATQWAGYRERAVGYQVKGDSDKMEASLHNARMSIRDLAFTLIHEDIHMGQYAPQETPKYENPAYETGISEERRVINEDMQKIREIQGRGANLPGDQDKLRELIEDLKISRDVYREHIQSMQSDVIKTGKVDPEKFKTSYDDMIKLVDEADALIKSVNQDVSDPCSGMAEPIRKLTGCD